MEDRPAPESIPSGIVTFLFTDIEGSSALWDREPAAMEEALVVHDDLIRSAVSEHHGYIFATGGDGFGVAFAGPYDAVAAAITAQLGLTAASHPLRVRMGIHSGSASERDRDYFGPAVNRCSRIASAAHGGQILVSAATRGLVQDEAPSPVDFVDLGEHVLRGLQRNERVFQVRHPELPGEFTETRAISDRHNLPSSLASFVGRDRERATVVDALDRGRLVTLTGIGGAGKTRLALEVGAELIDSYRDGVWLVDLAPLSDASGLYREVAQQLAVRETGGRGHREILRRHLADKQILLILDNCEHIVDVCADFASEMLSRAPAFSILATSRQPLDIAGESAHSIAALEVPDEAADDYGQIVGTDAVRLFAERAAAARPGFELDARSVLAVAEIVRALDGMPLAIELAAARVRALSPLEISERLDDRFRLLTGGNRSVRRHQTLRATVDWSYGLLDAAQQRFFSEMSVFRGSFDLAGASAVTGAGDLEALDAISDLVGKSLIGVEDGPSGTRYRLLETLRSYGLEVLERDGRLDDARDRHADHYQRLAVAAEAEYRGPRQASTYRRIEEDLDNLRAAFGWWDSTGAHEAAQSTAAALTWFWFVHRHMSEGREHLQRSLDAPMHSPTPQGARAILGAGYLAATQGDYDEAEQLLRRAFEALRTLGDQAGQTEAMIRLGMLELYRGDVDAARTELDLARAQAEAQGDDWSQAMCDYFLARVAVAADRSDRAHDLFAGALEQFLNHDDTFYIAWTSAHLGNTGLRDGRYDEAAAHYQEALRGFEDLGDEAGLAFAVAGLGVVAAEQGDRRTARALYERVQSYLAASPDSSEALAAMQLDQRSIQLLRSAVED